MMLGKNGMSNVNKKLISITRDALSSEVAELKFCKVIKRTEKGLGFVIHDADVPYDHYYLHSNNQNLGLDLGNTMLCLVAPSKRCQNRIDVEQFIQFTGVDEFMADLVSELDPHEFLGLFKFDWLKRFVIRNHFSELMSLINKELISIDDIVGHIGHALFLKGLRRLKIRGGLINIIRDWQPNDIISYLSLPTVERNMESEDYRCLWQRSIRGEIVLNEMLVVISDEFRKCLMKHLPLDKLSKTMKSIALDESVFCRYVFEFMAEDSIENQQDISKHIAEHNMLQARLLLALWDAKNSTKYVASAPSDWLDRITKLFCSSFLKKMFEAHAPERKLIENIIWHACTVDDHWRPLLSACEGKLVPSQRDNGAVTITMCRNNKCVSPSYSDIGNQSMFYQALVKWFSIDYNMLHTSEDYTRSIAAVNRWNEVLPRLYCRCCNDPLEYAEHNKGSMGNMAYGVSYWLCSNNDCNENSESIKLTHCIGCGKIIDSRDDKQACNSEELRSCSKVYICNTCASCCQRKHEGWSGICPQCGKSSAFTGEKDLQYRLICQFCTHPVKPPAKFKRIVAERIQNNSE
ncbi:MAG: hypothetical protein ACI8O8_002721 [Oleiphilaceae bacterium]|jgi:hypothetical protein